MPYMICDTYAICPAFAESHARVARFASHVGRTVHIAARLIPHARDGQVMNGEATRVGLPAAKFVEAFVAFGMYREL